MFKVFKSFVEKESECDICCLRTDRGGEFTSKEFNVFCVNHGIKRQLTAAYTPQQNGVAERKNRTILNMVRCLLSEKEMPKLFWPEAVRWGLHVLNRSLTVAVKEKTPEECWSGNKPNVEYFRIFGCIANVHIPDRGRTKLDEKSHRCVFIGVSEESKAYRLYDPKTKKVIVSRDVVFDENEGWNWRKSDDGVSDIFTWEDTDNDGEISDYDEKSVEGDDLGTEGVENDNEIEGGNDDTVLGENVEVLEDEDGDTSGENGLAAPENDTPGENNSSISQGRIKRTPRWMDDYVHGAGFPDDSMCFMVHDDPICFDEAVKQKKWRKAMDLEMEAIVKNKTWELVIPPEGIKRIGVKWIFRTKLNEKGEVDKCKAHLVVKGYAQRHGIDYSEVFAPVARWDTIRLILALAA
jgi:hypothetical protein